MSEGFDLDWLDLREPQDALARSEAVAARLLALLPARPRLLDLGAGTGSLFRWLAPRIGRAQAWTLVDRDKAMLEAAFDTIADRAEQVGLKVTFPNRKAMLVHAPGGAWRVEALAADLAEAPEILPLASHDAVLSSALCDLVSAAWVERMAASLRLPFYAALCVNGRAAFAPPHPADAAVLTAFRRDQRRDKGFGGPALGPLAPAAIAAAFAAHGFSVLRGASDWRVRQRGPLPMAAPGMRTHAFLTELVLGHAQAARRQDRRGGGAIGDWTDARLNQIAMRRLGLRIGHRDLLAIPPGR
ncbi:class I SAM-dependent methyltransferase [Siccirubricoccus sp. KC 17139]|uniref:Class I SAM-dependent methyltransferase n=1 Tax=Siccirubricoccus soli TaxID=2899147 RepID=A0ABT1D4N0_9PROT|nr:class I SAM-dependent methyltransferase [Siccirubricoccus soli]MCO6416883.1 class I SAM-dependent methyltransferase [Siccirubricoccus soli]MCP2683018.1 class I SAM-dependent methyltransferase [Siccirubricoccus soli]